MHKSSTWVGKGILPQLLSYVGNAWCMYIETNITFLKNYCTNLWMLVHPREVHGYTAFELA